MSSVWQVRLRRQFWGALALGLLWPGAFLQAATARAALHEFLDGAQVLASEFEQTVTSGEGRVEEQSEGQVALALPQQFRFEYTTPWPQLIVADGERVWVYDPDLDQATVRLQASAEAQSPLTLILEPKAIDQRFVVTEGGEENGLQWLLLQPKEERADFDRLDLGFNAQGLGAMRYRAPGGQQTELRFAQWQRNSDLPGDYFSFEPPPGVDVIGLEELQDGAANVQGLGD
ncbi:MAG: outer membrane lipoprotein chaperone LolA [Lysobacterales bacterium]